MKINESSTTLYAFRTTQETTNYDRTDKIDWLVPIAITVALYAVTLWLLISLIHYGVKTKKWKKSANNNNARVLNSGSVYSSMIGCAVLCLSRYSVSFAHFSFGFDEGENELCDSLADALYGTYAFTLCFAATFLWARQRAFYANRLLNVNYNKKIKFFSFTSIAFVVGYGVSVTILNTFPNNYAASPQGCVRQFETTQTTNWIPAIVGVAFYNLVMLGLLIYALTHVQTFEKAQAAAMRQQQTTNCHGTKKLNKNSNISSKSCANDKQISKNCDSSKSTTSARSFGKECSSATRIKLILQKTLIFAVISILVDLFLQIFSNYIVNPDGHRRATNLLFDISAFLNLLFVILSFAKYKKMIMSPFQKF